MAKKSEQRVFKEACDGFGFQEVPQTVDGVYCDGCYEVHKRPTRMFSNGRETLCREQVVELYNPED